MTYQIATTMFRRDAVPLLEYLSRHSVEARAALSPLAADSVARVEEGINIQHELATLHFWAFRPAFVPATKLTRLQVSIIRQNLLYLHSSLELTRAALYMPARTLMRHVFEALIIGKFCTVTSDDTQLEKWLAGDTIYFTNAILKRIVDPSPSIFRECWSMMSGFTHATAYALQPDVEFTKSEEDIQTNLSWLEMLIDCNYHLLSSQVITGSLRGYAKIYRDEALGPRLRSRARELLNAARPGLPEKPRQLIKSYKRQWQLQS